MDDVVVNEDDGDALPPRLQDDADDVSPLLDAERGSGLIEDQHVPRGM
jgi:hypothetical protein